MTGTNDSRMEPTAESFARGVKSRARYLMLAGMLTVALVFGISFYVALLAQQSAVARQFPELEPVAEKLKGMLMVNTIAIAAIIIGSFFLLASIITSRMFRPLARMQADLLAMADKRLPRRGDAPEGGPFAPLESAWNAGLSAIHEKEIKEIKELADCICALDRIGSASETARRMRELADRKRAFIGVSAPLADPKGKELPKDPLFIQPK